VVPPGKEPGTVGMGNWRKFMDVTHGVTVFTPLMLAQKSECHIITAFTANLIIGGGCSYAATKHAVVALSESIYLVRVA